MNLALFDFDGTITRRDSFLRFLWYTDKARFLKTFVSHLPHIVLYKLKWYPNEQLKERFLEGLFKKMAMEELQTRVVQYSNDVLPSLIRDGFWERLRWHQDNDDTIVVVSASPTFLLTPWCSSHHIDLIGTEVELDSHGRLTGKIQGRNCMGEEKVRRIKLRYELESFDELYAYGDTSGDSAMLALAPPPQRFYKPFR